MSELKLVKWQQPATYVAPVLNGAQLCSALCRVLKRYMPEDEFVPEKVTSFLSDMLKDIFAFQREDIRPRVTPAMDLFFEELSTGSISVENFQKRLKEVDDFAVFIDAAVSTAAAIVATGNTVMRIEELFSDEYLQALNNYRITLTMTGFSYSPDEIIAGNPCGRPGPHLREDVQKLMAHYTDKDSLAGADADRMIEDLVAAVHVGCHGLLDPVIREVVDSYPRRISVDVFMNLLRDLGAARVSVIQLLNGVPMETVAKAVLAHGGKEVGDPLPMAAIAEVTWDVGLEWAKTFQEPETTLLKFTRDGTGVNPDFAVQLMDMGDDNLDVRAVINTLQVLAETMSNLCSHGQQFAALGVTYVTVIRQSDMAAATQSAAEKVVEQPTEN